MGQNGLFIVFEGIDGAGKTTQVDLLQQHLQAKGARFVRSKEPTDGPWGRKIRHSAQHGRLPVDEELHAFMMDREEHSARLIRPSLADGKIVLLDRYYYSTIAYQGSRGADTAAIWAAMTAQFPMPDAVFVIDVPPEIGIDRISEGRREQPNDFEKLSGLTDARQAFLEMARHHAEIHVIDGRQSVDDVHRQVLSKL